MKGTLRAKLVLFILQITGGATPLHMLPANRTVGVERARAAKAQLLSGSQASSQSSVGQEPGEAPTAKCLAQSVRECPWLRAFAVSGIAG